MQVGIFVLEAEFRAPMNACVVEMAFVFLIHDSQVMEGKRSMQLIIIGSLSYLQQESRHPPGSSLATGLAACYHR